MCTVLSMRGQRHYFGRNLDLDRSLGEEICVIPRRFPLSFCNMEIQNIHHAFIGMATVIDDTPLFYDGANEHGLAMAGLNFPGNAHYAPPAVGFDNVASFEFIPWILCQCKTVTEAKALLSRMRLTDIAFSKQIPPAPLHWIIADKEQSIVVESMRDGLHVYPNPTGVLSNNPPFPLQLKNLEGYSHLRTDNPETVRKTGLSRVDYCQGLGAVGLPGDLSSKSRFVRAVFGLQNSLCPPEEAASVGQLFHLLSSVAMTRGLCRTDEGTWDMTIYSACINTEKGLYYYTTYGNRRISVVDLYSANLEGSTLGRFPLLLAEDILRQS